MNPLGIVSVTLRNQSVEELVQLCQTLGCDGIEWGSDVHVLADDLDRACEVAKICQQQNCTIFSYGSYYKLGQGKQIEQDFLPLLKAAQCLKTDTVRIWAGRTASKNVDESTFLQVVQEAKQCASLASTMGMRVAFEYHRKSLTDCHESALHLLQAINMENCLIYWQPNPELTIQQNTEELQAILPYLCRVHVFYWQADNTRLSLVEGTEAWKTWLPLIPRDIPLLLEFVKDDAIKQLTQDFHTLQSWLK